MSAKRSRSWRRRLFSKAGRPKRGVILRLQPLEDRCVPANIVVNIAGEDTNPGHGNISLRDALAMANSDNQADIITFAPGITMVSITNPAGLFLTETGAANQTTVDGGGNVTLQWQVSTGTNAGLNVGEGAYVAITGITISGASGTGAGGGISVDGNATLTDVTLTANSAASGGLYNAGSMQLIDSAIADHTATQQGGGIFGSGHLVIENSTISGNFAGTKGGGIYSQQFLYTGLGIGPVADSGVFVFNTTISSNAANGSGGGVYTNKTSTFNNDTITANRSDADNSGGEPGGGLYTSAVNTVQLANTIVSGNFRGPGSVTADDLAGELTAASSHNLIGGNVMLGPLANNGGPTKTIALLPGSPAINAGSNAFAVDHNGAALGPDQRGVTRISGGTVDIGAYELQPSKAPATPEIFAAGEGPGGAPRVNVYNAAGGLVASFLAFPPSFTFGVTVAVGDVNGDGVADIIVGEGPGGSPIVQVFDGTKLTELQADGELSSDAVLTSILAYPTTFHGGVNVAAGDLNGDGKADIVTGAGPGGGPHVEVFNGANFSTMASFYAYDPSFRGGVNVAAGDMTGDGHAEVITGPSAGGGPQVNVFDGYGLAAGGATAAAAINNPLRSFYAFSPGFRGGVTVAASEPSAAAGSEIVAGAGPGGGPEVTFIDYRSMVNSGSFYAYNPGFRGGVNVATTMFTGMTTPALITAPGAGGGPEITISGYFQPPSPTSPSGSGPILVSQILASPVEGPSSYAFDPSFLGGVFVG
jgi:hypothetical protein